MSDKAATTERCCRWCRRLRHWPCANTRDMTDAAIEGDDICYRMLAELGGGEKGMRYVELNRPARRLGLRRAVREGQDGYDATHRDV